MPTTNPARRSLADATSSALRNARGVSIITHSCNDFGAPSVSSASASARTCWPVSTFGTSTPSAAEPATAAKSSLCQSVSNPLMRTTTSRGR